VEEDICLGHLGLALIDQHLLYDILDLFQTRRVLMKSLLCQFDLPFLPFLVVPSLLDANCQEVLING
jgi:hypothetical protein